jgi:hypothetical protein
MRTILLFVLLTWCRSILAQQVVTTAGSTFSNSGGSISYTLGETVAQTTVNGDKALTQGFQQSKISVSVISGMKDPDISVSIFPNPVSDYLVIRVFKNKDVKTQYVASLYNINSILLIDRTFGGSEITIPILDLPPGIYLLKLTVSNKELKTFKIIKN